MLAFLTSKSTQHAIVIIVRMTFRAALPLERVDLMLIKACDWSA
jgi:hypothetical protein